ncbi:glycosyltransferase family 2 protein [bacterium]|nr:MAG: glycosyltransferase family 2 protein [bacterium]
MNGISVLIIAYNESENIVGAIESVRFAEEIVVVDNCSNDNTVEIAEQNGAIVFRTDDNLGYSQAKKFGLEKCNYSWVLWLDADERASLELAEEISNIIKNGEVDSSIAGFYIHRKSFFVRKWMKHCGWGNEKVLRLFRKNCAQISDDLVHESIIIAGQTRTLSNPILHYTAPDFITFFQKQMKYASLSAQQMISQNKSIGLGKIFFNPLATFFKIYFVKLGFLDGLEGFFLSVIQSTYVFAKYVQAYYIKKKMASKNRKEI